MVSIPCFLCGMGHSYTFSHDVHHFIAGLVQVVFHGESQTLQGVGQGGGVHLTAHSLLPSPVLKLYVIYDNKGTSIRPVHTVQQPVVILHRGANCGK